MIMFNRFTHFELVVVPLLALLLTNGCRNQEKQHAPILSIGETDNSLTYDYSEYDSDGNEYRGSMDYQVLFSFAEAYCNAIHIENDSINTEVGKYEGHTEPDGTEHDIPTHYRQYRKNLCMGD